MADKASPISREDALTLWIRLLNTADPEARRTMLRQLPRSDEACREFNMLMTALLTNSKDAGDSALFDRLTYLMHEMIFVSFEGSVSATAEPVVPESWPPLDAEYITHIAEAPAFRIQWHTMQMRMQMSADTAEIRIALAQDHIRRAEFAEALEHLVHATMLDPYNPRAHIAAGLVCIDMSNVDAAVPYLEAGIEAFECRQEDFDDLSDHDVTLWTTGCNQLAGIYAKSGRFADGVRCAELGARARPDAWQHKVLADCYRAAGRHDDAIAAARTAVKLDPQCAEAQNSLGILLRDTFDIEAAIEAFTAAIRANPNLVQAYNNLGTCLKALGRLEEARAAYRDALNTGPERPAPYTNLGNVSRLGGDVEEAEQSYRKALDIDPDYVNARLQLATLLLDLNRWEEAVSEVNCSTTILIKHGLSPASDGIPDLQTLPETTFVFELHPVYRDELKARFDDLSQVIHCALYEYIGGVPSNPRQGEDGVVHFVDGQAVESWIADGMAIAKSVNVADWNRVTQFLLKSSANEYCRRMPDADVAILALHLLTDLIRKQGWIKEALWLCGALEALPLSRGSILHLAKTYNYLGQEFRKGYCLDPERAPYSASLARAVYRHAYRLYAEAQDYKFMAVMLWNMGVACEVEGKIPEAIEFFEQSGTLDEEAGNPESALGARRRVAQLKEASAQA